MIGVAVTLTGQITQRRRLADLQLTAFPTPGLAGARRGSASRSAAALAMPIEPPSGHRAVHLAFREFPVRRHRWPAGLEDFDTL